MVKSRVAGRLTWQVGGFSPLSQVQKSLPNFIPKGLARLTASSFWFVCLISVALALSQTHAHFFVALYHGCKHQAHPVSRIQICL